MCSRCILDTSDPDIYFDSEGICNHCHDTARLLATLPQSHQEEKVRLSSIATLIKQAKGNNEYDSLLGISGGVDSSYVAYLAKKIGLSPLVVHFDNGWNSELAVNNINKLVDTLGFDLSTYVIDWEEFKDLQRSFLKASVVDIELLTDHAITAAMFHLAHKHKIKFVLSGNNYATESGMPGSWVWNKQDKINIIGIHKRFGTRKMKSFPTLGLWKWIMVSNLGLGFKFVPLLNNAMYKKNEAMKVIKSDLGWQYYGGKHYESIFTKFYQAYILPEKFGIDKRKVHLSSLIRNEEMSRDEALEELAKPLYDPIELKNDKVYVLKKLGFSEDEFVKIMNLPPKSHNDYPSSARLLKILRNTKNILLKLNFL